MNDAYYAIEAVITLLSLRDAAATRRSDGRRVRHYVLSRETEQAVDIKKKYLKGSLTGAEVVKWCYTWIGSHEFSEDEVDYLKRNRYLGWLREKCTKEG